jgi:hypothetical protein
MRYQYKPTEVEAVQYKREGKHAHIVDFCEGMFYYANHPEDKTKQTHMLKTNLGSVILNDQDYIVKHAGEKNFMKYNQKQFNDLFQKAEENFQTMTTTKTSLSMAKITLPPINMESVGETIAKNIRNSMRKSRNV